MIKYRIKMRAGQRTPHWFALLETIRLIGQDSGLVSFELGAAEAVTEQLEHHFCTDPAVVSCYLVV